MAIKQLIQRYSLQPHPEGGFYKEEYRSTETISVARGERPAMTAIYFLLQGQHFSAWHQIQSDEVWAYLEGNADCCIHMIDELGDYSKQYLGTHHDTARQLFTVPARVWFAVDVLPSDQNSDNSDDDYALCSCIVAPGFHWQDFALPSRETLSKMYPQHDTLIQQFTRDSVDAKPT